MIPEEDVGNYLAAFADGELGEAESLDVLQYLARNPKATGRVVGQRRLRDAAERYLKQATPALPRALRHRIGMLVPAANVPSAGHAAAVRVTG